MEEDILNYLYKLSCFVGHPVSIKIVGWERYIYAFFYCFILIGFVND